MSEISTLIGTQGVSTLINILKKQTSLEKVFTIKIRNNTTQKMNSCGFQMKNGVVSYPFTIIHPKKQETSLLFKDNYIKGIEGIYLFEIEEFDFKIAIYFKVPRFKGSNRFAIDVLDRSEKLDKLLIRKMKLVDSEKIRKVGKSCEPIVIEVNQIKILAAMGQMPTCTLKLEFETIFAEEDCSSLC